MNLWQVLIGISANLSPFRNILFLSRKLFVNIFSWTHGRKVPSSYYTSSVLYARVQVIEKTVSKRQ